MTDFGIARAARRGETLITVGDGPIGTPAYMAPEQVEGKQQLDRRLDLYALGVMLFEMLTGKLPWNGETAMAVALARLLHDPPKLSDYGEYPPELTVAVRCAMAKRPEDRYSDVTELADALRQVDRDCEAVAPTRQIARADADDRSLPVGRSQQSSGFSAVAVLPFRNRGGSSDAYLAEGFTEELIDELSMFDRVRVRPLGAVTKYMGETPDPSRVGRDLDVQVIVDGSLRKLGERLRVRVSVSSVAEGFQIWSGKFKGRPKQLFDMMEQAAEAVADALMSARRSERGVQLEDTVALDLYMRARYQMHRSWQIDMTGPIRLFEKALEREPGDPRLLTGLATAMARKAFLNPAQSEKLLQQAREIAGKAIASAPDWSEPYYSRALVEFNAARFGPALENARAALMRQDDLADAHDLMGRILSETGPLDGAVDHLERALNLNPMLFRARWDLARVHAYLGDWEQTDMALGAPPDELEGRVAHFMVRTRLDTWRDTPIWLDEPVPELPEAPALFDAVEVNRRMLRGEEMTRDDLTIVFRRAEGIEADGRRKALAYQVATEFASINGWLDEASEILSTALDVGLNDLMWLTHCPALEPLRGRRDVEEIRARLEGRVETMHRTHLTSRPS